MEDARIEGVEALDDGGNKDDDHAYSHCVVELEEHREPFRPAQVWMRRSEEALDEYYIYDEEDDHTNSDKDLGIC